ncbi:MAG: hypothetical protein CVU64_19475 [Deltaproteobacteria bacterium HGW-Deltaproteobacteria-21]|nr:MAG: hypothetical protein CVU64_19475 [Deltaproteobacteria bacterium HGW-Deltaproteobacteria-21]
MHKNRAGNNIEHSNIEHPFFQTFSIGYLIFIRCWTFDVHLFACPLDPGSRPAPGQVSFNRRDDFYETVQH